MPPSRRRNQNNEGRTTPDRFARAMATFYRARAPGSNRTGSGVPRRCGELPAGGVDLGAPGDADGGVHPEREQLVAELAHVLAGRPDHGIARRRVERDEVHVGAQRAGERRQLCGVTAPVVDVVDHGPLNGEAPAAGGHVVRTGAGQHLERIAAVDGHELVAQRIVGGVERDGEVHGQGLGGQAPDTRHNAHRREREMAGREAHVAVQPRDGPPDPVVVGQRLPHPHEDDVGDPPCRPGLPHGDGNLLDDLALGQLTLEPGLAGGAELAGHGATGLGGHADGHPVRVMHEDGLDLGPVVERPQPLGRLAGVG